MGPRHLSRGIVIMDPDRLLIQLASMGPRHLSRGIVGEGGTLLIEFPGFNGATAFEPWNRLDGTLFDPGHPSFNGATAFEPWNRPKR